MKQWIYSFFHSILLLQLSVLRFSAAPNALGCRLELLKPAPTLPPLVAAAWHHREKTPLSSFNSSSTMGIAMSNADTVLELVIMCMLCSLEFSLRGSPASHAPTVKFVPLLTSIPAGIISVQEKRIHYNRASR